MGNCVFFLFDAANREIPEGFSGISHTRISFSKTIINNNIKKRVKDNEKRTYCNSHGNNKWFVSIYCDSVLESDKNVNKLDTFWLINSEKECYLLAKEETETDKPFKFDLKQIESKDKEFEFSKIDSRLAMVSNLINKPPDKEESYPNRKAAVKDGEANNSKFKLVAYNTGEVESDDSFFLTYENIDSASKNPLGVMILEPVRKDIENEARYNLDLPPKIGPIKFKSFFKIRNVASNSYLTVMYIVNKDNKTRLLILNCYRQTK